MITSQDELYGIFTLVLYKMLQAYSMFDINVTGSLDLTASKTYTTTVGNCAANASVIILPDADQVKTSIWPGVKHKEAFSTLVESLVQMTCIDFTNFLKLAEFTI